MAMFLLHIAFLLALALIAAGLVLWHQGRQIAAGPLRIASVALIAGALLSALCIAYYGVRYQAQGDFDHAYAVHPPMGHMMGGGGMMERMERGPERPSLRRPGETSETTPPAETPAPSDAAEHEAHHPDAAAPR